MSEKVVIVQSGNEEYAFSVDLVVSIEKIEKITPIPDLPSYLLGLMKIRGELVPILDLEQILYNQPSGGEEETRIVVIQSNAMNIGFVVKDAKEILDVPPEIIIPATIMAFSKNAYFPSIINLENRVIPIIDPFRLTASLVGMDAIEAYVQKKQKDVQSSEQTG